MIELKVKKSIVVELEKLINEPLGFKKKGKKIIFVSSPLKAYGKYTFDQNVSQAIQYCRDIILYGDIPIAPHVYFTRFVDDNDPYERNLAMEAGLQLLKFCSQINVYIKNGYISKGMRQEIDLSEELGIEINRIYIGNKYDG